MYFISTFLSIAGLLLLLVPGVIVRKLKLVSSAAAKDLSSILIYIGMPALIFYCMMEVDITLVTPIKLLMCILLSVLIHVIAYVIVKLVYRKDNETGKKAASSFSAVFANCGFVGIPITQIAINNYSNFGVPTSEAYAEAMLYVTLFNVIFNLLTWTLGVTLYRSGNTQNAEIAEDANGETGGKKVKHGKAEMIKKALLNPCTIATIVALPFTLTGFSLLDPIVIGDFQITQVASIITYMYNLCVPVSMCILGIRIADMEIVPMFKSKYTYIAASIKLIIVPLITLGLLVLLNIWLEIGMPLVLAMTVMAATPAATTALAFAERFDGDSVVASQCIMFGTVASVVTIPVFLLIATSIPM